MNKTILIFLLINLTIFSVFAQNQKISLKPKVIAPDQFSISKPLRKIASESANPSVFKERESDRKNIEYPFKETALPKGTDEVWQKTMGASNVKWNPTTNFEGMALGQNGTHGGVPDTQGDVGPNHYFQVVNTAYQIWDKEGNSLLGPSSLADIWSGFNPTDLSDPIVLYDEQADRWFVSIFKSTSPFEIYVAVSQTSDPTGSWYCYSYGWDTLPDYAKYGIWQNGYYFGLNSSGYDVGAFDRNAMLNGQPGGGAVTWDNPYPTNGFCILPFDNDGDFASSGTPGQFITFNDDAWGGTDQLWIYQLNVDWNHPAGATFYRTQTIDVTPFDSDMGPYTVGVSQPGTSQKLATVSNQLMFRAQYRKFGTHESIVCCHTVDVDDTDHAGIRWYELRRTSGNWGIYQQSTYAPDADNRFVCSIAMNANEDIALGYSVASSSVYPSIRYTGRKGNDPINSMTIPEGEVFKGSHSQTGSDRWGDYACMSVDPTDDLRFWFTTEYSNGGNYWRTRIANIGVDDATYCTASGGCDEFISRVQMGSIDNSSGCSGYADYTTISTSFPANTSQQITVTNGPPSYGTDECGIWIDWNQDGDFNDANEQINIGGSPGTGPYTATVSPPYGVSLGFYTMRIRIKYNSGLNPCGQTTYGEVEDYSIELTPKVPNEWTGNVSHDWNDANNWSLNHMPTYDEDVIITNAGWQPAYVYISDAACHNLTINTGGELEVVGKTLTVNANIMISGQLSMSDPNGIINCYGNVHWNNNSSANFTATTMFNVYGNWFFNSGSDVQIENGWVAFEGNVDSQIKSKSPTSYLHSLYVNKSSAALRIINDANSPLVMSGDINIQANSQFINESTQDIYCEGDFYNNGFFDFSSSAASNTSFVFDGINQSITMDATFSFFNNLTINPSGWVNMYSGDINVDGNMTIESGILYAQGNTINLKGDWVNNVGIDAFNEGTGRVVFDGNVNQYCSTEEFNELEINNAVGALYVSGTQVTCAAYDWTAGAIDVFNGGVFTANDLIDDGIFGTYILSDVGIINLTNNDGYVDLNGEIYINNGTMNVYGGTTASYWPYAANGKITMLDGVLDFHDQGIYVYDSPSFSFIENISGGTIRTPLGFIGDRADFTPSGGTFEFYGNSDYTISQTTGCTLFDVNINKSAKKGSKISSGTPVIDKRSGKVLSDGGKSNTITLNSDFVILNDLTINSGELKLDGHELSTYYSTNVFGTLTMDNPADVFYAGINNDGYDCIVFRPGSNGNLSSGTVNSYGWIVTYEGCTFNTTTANTFLFSCSTEGGIINHEPTAAYGNVEVDVSHIAAVSPLTTKEVIINGDLSLDGDFGLNGRTLSCLGNINVYNGGTLLTDENAILKLGNNSAITVNTGGEIQFMGTAAGQATLTHAGSGRYSCVINGGTIAAKHSIFEYLAVDGIELEDGAIVSPTSSFDYCIFQNGSPDPLSDYIWSKGVQNFTATGVEFDNSSGGVAYNVYKAVDAGHITFLDATGFFAGPTYEYDPYNRVDWTGTYTGLWTGIHSSDWFTPENWSDYRVPVDTSNVTIPTAVPNYPLITGANDSCYSVTIDAGASLEIGNGCLGVHTMDIYGEMIMHNTNSRLNSYHILWEAGSTDDINNGWISTAYWNFEDGTNAQLGTGNTAYITDGVTPYDDDASFGNIILFASNKKSPEGKTFYPVRVSGDCLIKTGSINWSIYVPLLIEGNWEIEAGASVSLENGAGISYCQNLILNGSCTVDNNSEVDVHGAFDFGATGELSVLGGSFVVDKLITDDWQYLNGKLTLTSGLFELTHSSARFSSTATSDVSGGTFRTMSAFYAGDPGVFQPSGGTVEVIDTSIVTFEKSIYCTNGNYFHNLFIEHPGDGWLTTISGNTTIQNNLTFESGYNMIYGNNVAVTVNGNVDINDFAHFLIYRDTKLLLSGNSILNVNNGGSLRLDGGDGDLATISHTSGYYELNVNAGGTISADTAVFEYMGTPYGINIKSGSTILSSNDCFNSCEFRNGDPSVTNGALLTINNNQDLTIKDSSFPTTNTTYNVRKNVNSGSVSFIDYTGAFSGSAYEYDPYNRINWVEQSFELNLKAFLEGPFKTSNMDATLTNIPLSQPYNTSPWNYAGAESVNSIPNANIVDWVLVELRDASSAGSASSSTRLARQAAFILKDGSIVGIDGSSTLQFTASPNNNLYAIVWHRNHLGIMSALALTESSGTYTYNFTTAVNKAYLSGQTDLNGKAAMLGGDIDANGIINMTDKTIWSSAVGTKAYISSDLDLNTQVDNKDKNDILINNLNEQTKIPN